MIHYRETWTMLSALTRRDRNFLSYLNFNSVEYSNSLIAVRRELTAGYIYIWTVLNLCFQTKNIWEWLGSALVFLKKTKPTEVLSIIYQSVLELLLIYVEIQTIHTLFINGPVTYTPCLSIRWCLTGGKTLMTGFSWGNWGGSKL